MRALSRIFRGSFAALTRNLISLIGVILAAASAALILVLAAFTLVGVGDGPHADIFTFVVLPLALVLGLMLVPIGLWLQRRRERRAAGRSETPPPALPVVDLNIAGTRAAVSGYFLLILACLAVLGGAGSKGVAVLESARFCGQACHQTMQPEAVAHARSPHANVSCAQCHVGPGASWFVRSKINGLGEMVEEAFNSYPRPIPTPVHNLRPAREVCEQCHWPAKFEGDRLVVRTHYADDEKNTQTKTVLSLHVGGQAGQDASGIHWHVGHGMTVRYLADPTRETIYTVELNGADGAHKVFNSSTAAPADAQWRTMDCVDCHNRPTHIFRDPEDEMDSALDEGRIDTSLPFIKREGLRMLKLDYASEQQARAGIQRQIVQFYGKQYPAVASGHAAAIAQAGKALGDIWSWNVFPQMKVTWDTYPNHIGHQQSPGCWRCHDNKHVTSSGEKIVKQCGLCHNVVAQDDPSPQILKDLD